MKTAYVIAQASIVAMSLMLTACGGGGGSGGPISTPTPVYKKLDELTGNQTFQTAGVRNIGPGGVGPLPTTGQARDNFGSGVVVNYTEASDSYQLTAPGGGASVTFTPGDVNTALSTANQIVFDKTVGTTRDIFRLNSPSANGVKLSYTLVGTWNRIDTTNNGSVNYIAVGGGPTIASDMPTTGSASYSLFLGGTALRKNTAYQMVSGPGSSSFSVNFATGSITTALHLVGTPAGGGAPLDLGTFLGNGTITSGSPGFTGTIGAGGGFSGAFFGPKATEMGFGWYINDGLTNANGVAGGIKQ